MAISSRTNLSCICAGKKYLLLMKNVRSETNIWRFTPLNGMTRVPPGINIVFPFVSLPAGFTYDPCFRTPKGLLRMGTSNFYGCPNVILMSNKWMFYLTGPDLYLLSTNPAVFMASVIFPIASSTFSTIPA